MEVIAGCVIEKDGKMLMVQEGKEYCRGMWDFPAGHVEEGENIRDAALREMQEEIGCKVNLKGLLPVMSTKAFSGTTLVLFKFVAEIAEGNVKVDGDEILDAKWVPIPNIKKMHPDELRGYEEIQEIVKCFEEGKVFPVNAVNGQFL